MKFLPVVNVMLSSDMALTDLASKQTAGACNLSCSPSAVAVDAPPVKLVLFKGPMANPTLT